MIPCAADGCQLYLYWVFLQTHLNFIIIILNNIHIWNMGKSELNMCLQQFSLIEVLRLSLVYHVQKKRKKEEGIFFFKY